MVQQGQGNTTACTNSLKKKKQQCPIFADLRVQEKEDAGEKRCKIKKKNQNKKPGRLPDPVFTFMILTEWAVLILLKTEELTGYSFLFKPFGLLGTNRCVHTEIRTKDTLSLPLNRLPS